MEPRPSCWKVIGSFAWATISGGQGSARRRRPTKSCTARWLTQRRSQLRRAREPDHLVQRMHFRHSPCRTTSRSDKANDGVPDGDPIVPLEGFGMEDTHSVASSLPWGPDGWLYASQGSTVSGNISRPGLDKQPVHSMGQLIWRYHPETRRYEIFAE